MEIIKCLFGPFIIVFFTLPICTVMLTLILNKFCKLPWIAPIVLLLSMIALEQMYLHGSLGFQKVFFVALSIGIGILQKRVILMKQENRNQFFLVILISTIILVISMLSVYFVV